MVGCVSCHGAKDLELDWSSLEMTLLEVGESSVKLAFRAPSRSSGTCLQTLCRSAREKLDFTVSVIGGPDSDIRGPREERLAGVRAGAHVVHEVCDLQPETEYTVRVAVALPESVAESLEVRTASATSSPLGVQDWGENPAQGKGKAEDPGGSKKGQDDGAGVGPAGRTPSRVADDTSTMAPSEAGREERFDDSEEEPAEVRPPEAPLVMVTRRASAGPSPEAAVAVEELEEPAAVVQCDLCSLLDCLRQRSRRSLPPRPAEVVLDVRGNELQPQQPAPAAAPAPACTAPALAGQETPEGTQRQGFQPYRIPFPGVPVDPASVGLSHLEQRNAAVLEAHLLAQRTAPTTTPQAV
mmetsp:Transcript_54611/g.175140  ORF Transcript_54611/g.175140 Transcript_54611/m.175140 type:complete len:354 (-) Transcript_54611:95-1156(-)